MTAGATRRDRKPEKASTTAVEKGPIARPIEPLLRHPTLASRGEGDIERFRADVAAGRRPGRSRSTAAIARPD